MIGGRTIMTLEDRAVQNGTPMFLVEKQDGAGYAVVRSIGMRTVEVGEGVDLAKATRLALAILENDPKALADLGAKRLLAMAVLGMFASASLRIAEAGKEVVDVQGPA